MKVLKILQYLVSLVHLGAQIFYFIGWQRAMGSVTNIKKIEAVSLINNNLEISQFSFLYVLLGLLTLAFYLTVSHHLSLWIQEANLKEEFEKIQAGMKLDNA